MLEVDDAGVPCTDRDFTTISAAVAAAQSDDTIIICPGTYVENVILDKSLTLLGAQAGVDARGRMTTDESVVTPFIAASRTLEFRTGSAGSIIDGFTFLS